MSKTQPKYFFIISFMLSLLILNFQNAWGEGASYHNDIVELYGENWNFDEEIVPAISDPYESINQKVFNLNTGIYDHVFEPISKGYDIIIPKKAQGGIDNFFVNLRTPIRLFNCLFQGKFKGATTEFARFVVNSTVGIGGFLDPATAYWDLPVQDEDFGQTLGKWGFKSGPYIVWPVIGPSSIRDTFGFIGDTALNPLTWLSYYDVLPDGAALGAGALNNINNFSLHIRDNYKSIYKSAIDPYIAIQDAYIQSREQKIKK